jgi:NADPH:quinone reductase-like Zn-dependent oxidoreductase
MKAIVIDNYGEISELKEREMPQPIPKDNQVLIEMHATSINPIDWKVRRGYLKEMMPFEFPIILGWDAAGIVEDVGSEVTAFKVGDRVFSRPNTTARGTYAEFIVAEEDLVANIPNNIGFEEAAAMPLAGLTAWQCLVDFSEIKSGDKVLIHAGSGGVGSLAIQIAKSLGAYVASTASGRNEELLTSLGVDKFIDYQNTAFETVLSDYDIVFDTMGGAIQEKSFNVLKKGGKLVSIISPPNEEKAKEKNIKAGLVWLQPNGKQLQQLADLMEKGSLKSIVGHVYHFSDKALQEAHELSETHHAKGKIVVKIK